MELFKSKKDKLANRTCLLQLKQGQKNVKIRRGDSSHFCLVFSERTFTFSLESWKIRPLAVFGTRRKAALRREGFAWVPNLGSLLKLREVGVSPYLGFIFHLRVFTMFALNEVVRGRLISFKAWNRGVGF